MSKILLSKLQIGLPLDCIGVRIWLGFVKMSENCCYHQVYREWSLFSKYFFNGVRAVLRKMHFILIFAC